jgi:hypothetical protein
MKNCKQCQCILTKKYQKQFCSLSCAGKVNANKNKPNLSIIYNQNPKLCKFCGSAVSYQKRQNEFCGKSCSAKFNNPLKIRTFWSKEAKNKVSQKMKQLYKDGKLKNLMGRPPNRISEYPFCRIYTWVSCNNCKAFFWQQKPDQKCCSISCRDSIRSKNKCAKVRISYFNRNENIDVNLQSSWEKDIAIWLDSRNIVWTRPSKRLHWFDQTNQKWRTYLPDFYLPKFQKFLDVKNPMKMKEDADKIKQLTQLFPLSVGNREEIKSTVLSW